MIRTPEESKTRNTLLHLQRHIKTVQTTRTDRKPGTGLLTTLEKATGRSTTLPIMHMATPHIKVLNWKRYELYQGRNSTPHKTPPF
jgi:hypothetical protein